jgi:hypothetical protein
MTKRASKAKRFTEVVTRFDEPPFNRSGIDDPDAVGRRRRGADRAARPPYTRAGDSFAMMRCSFYELNTGAIISSHSKKKRVTT